MNKKLFLVILVGLIFVLAQGAWAAEEVKISVNGEKLTPAVSAQVIDDTTYVPLRFVSQALGAEVGWDSSTTTAIVRKGINSGLDINAPAIKLNDGNLKLEINGQLVQGIKVLMINDTTMVPLRVISENLGASVDWDDNTQTVLITMGGVEFSPVQEAAKADPQAMLKAMEILEQSNQKVLDKGAFSYEGIGTISMRISSEGFGLDFNFKMDTSGKVKYPDQLYYYVVMQPEANPLLGLESEEPIMSEIYRNGNIIYSREGKDSLWEMTEIGADVPAAEFTEFNNQIDPTKTFELVKNAGVDLAYIGLQEEGGHSYHVVKADLSGKNAYELAKGLLGEEIGLSDVTDAEELEKVFNGMHVSYDYFINQETMDLEKALSNVHMEVEEDGALLIMDMDFEVFYEIGADVVFPEITEDIIE